MENVLQTLTLQTLTLTRAILVMLPSFDASNCMCFVLAPICLVDFCEVYIYYLNQLYVFGAITDLSGWFLHIVSACPVLMCADFEVPSLQSRLVLSLDAFGAFTELSGWFLWSVYLLSQSTGCVWCYHRAVWLISVKCVYTILINWMCLVLSPTCYRFPASAAHLMAREAKTSLCHHCMSRLSERLRPEAL